MFFIMEDCDEEIAIAADQYADSFARDTNADELKEVRRSKYIYPLINLTDHSLDLAPNGRGERQESSRS